MKNKLLISTAMLCLLAAGAQAQTRYITFGDSLSDTGNLFAASGQPPSPYFSGRFSNGPVWIEYLSPGQARFTGGLTPTGSLNFAFGGARTDTTVASPPGTATQIGAFIAGGGRIAASDVVTIWAGANDIFQGLPVAGANPATAQATIQTIAGNAARNVATQIGQLSALGARTIVVLNLPDFAQLPQFIGTGNTASLAGLASGTYNTTLEAALTSVKAANPAASIIQVNANGLFQAITANPGAFGFTNVTAQCLTTPSCITGSAATQDGFAFFDGVHPTAQGHRLIAQAVVQYLTAQDRALSAASITDIGVYTRQSSTTRALDRLSDYAPVADKTDIYISVIGDQAGRTARSGAPAFTYGMGGLELGVIRHVNGNFSLGFALSAQTGQADPKFAYGNKVSYDSTAFAGDFVARYTSGPYFIKAALGATLNRTTDFKRSISLGNLENTASTTGKGYSIATEVGANYALSSSITATPSVRIGYLFAETDEFSETGIIAPIRYYSRSISTMFAAGDVKVTAKVGEQASLYALVGYEAYLAQDVGALKGELAGNTANAFSRNIKGLENAGVTFGLGASSTLGTVPVRAEYRGAVSADGRTRHRGTISASLKF